MCLEYIQFETDWRAREDDCTILPPAVCVCKFLIEFQRRARQPTPVFLPREPHEQRSLVGHQEADIVWHSQSVHRVAQGQTQLSDLAHTLNTIEFYSGPYVSS